MLLNKMLVNIELRTELLCLENNLLSGVDLVDDVVTTVFSPVTAGLRHDRWDSALSNIARTLL